MLQCWIARRKILLFSPSIMTIKSISQLSLICGFAASLPLVSYDTLIFLPDGFWQDKRSHWLSGKNQKIINMAGPNEFKKNAHVYSHWKIGAKENSGIFHHLCSRKKSMSGCLFSLFITPYSSIRCIVLIPSIDSLMKLTRQFVLFCYCYCVFFPWKHLSKTDMI